MELNMRIVEKGIDPSKVNTRVKGSAVQQIEIIITNQDGKILFYEDKVQYNRKLDIPKIITGIKEWGEDEELCRGSIARNLLNAIGNTFKAF